MDDQLACANCGARGVTLRPCSACKLINYCTPVCQRTHWKKHKKECRKLDSGESQEPPVSPEEAEESFNAGCALFEPLLQKVTSGELRSSAEKGEVNKVINLFRKAASGGKGDAAWNLALMYRDGLCGIQADPTAALKFMKKAAKMGRADALVEVGRMFEDAADPAKAISYFRKYAEQGNPDALVPLGNALSRHGEQEEATKVFVEAASKGIPEACSAVAKNHELGLNGAKKDMKRALELYEQAERSLKRLLAQNPQNSQVAKFITKTQHKISQLRAAPKEPSQPWHEQASVQPGAEASFQAGRNLLGLNPLIHQKLQSSAPLTEAEQPTAAEAAKYFRKAAKGGVVAACMLVAQMYTVGFGLKADPEKALKYVETAAKLGNVEGMEKYAEHFGRRGDHKKAFEWFTKAANEGHPFACLNLAQMYEMGNVVVPRDIKRALELFELSLQIFRNQAVRNPQVAGQCASNIARIESKVAEMRSQLATTDEATPTTFRGAPVPQDEDPPVVLRPFKAPPASPEVEAQFKQGCKLFTTDLQRKANINSTAVVLTDEERKTVKRISIYFHHAAAGGHVHASMSLAAMHEMSYLAAKGSKPDQSACFKYTRKAANAGHPRAQYQVALTYLSGQGVQADPQKAFSYSMKSAEQGLHEGMFAVGLCHKQVGEQNEAVKWFAKASEVDEANYILAEYYQEGQGGVLKNLKRSLELYEKALPSFQNQLKWFSDDDPQLLESRSFASTCEQRIAEVRSALPDPLIGTKVRINGLTGRQDLNGRMGTVKGVIKSSGRYAVSVIGEESPLALRRESLNLQGKKGKVSSEAEENSNLVVNVLDCPGKHGTTECDVEAFGTFCDGCFAVCILGGSMFSCRLCEFNVCVECQAKSTEQFALEDASHSSDDGRPLRAEDLGDVTGAYVTTCATRATPQEQEEQEGGAQLRRRRRPPRRLPRQGCTPPSQMGTV